MLKIDATLSHVAVSAAQIVTLLESQNHPLVNIPSYGTAQTKAYVVGAVTERQGFRVFVYLRQPDNDEAITIYVSDPKELTAAQYRIEESEAARFLESMTFVMQDLNFRSLLPVQKEAEMQRVGIFEPPSKSSIVELIDAVTDGELAAEEHGPSEIFGGLSARQQDAFRRAGVLAQSGRQGPGSTEPAPSTKHTPPPPPPPELLASELPPLLTPSPAVPSPPAGQAQYVTPHPEPRPIGQPTRPGILTQPPVQTQPPPMTPSPSTGRGPFNTAPPAFSQAPAEPPPELDAEDQESLARLGRLLATFGVLAALSVPPSGCATTGKGEPLSIEHETQLQIANEHLARNRWAEAISVLEPVIEEAPYAREALHSVGFAYLNVGHRQKAEGYLRRAVDADPKWSVPKNTLASILIPDGRCDEAEALLTAVLADIFYTTPEFAEHNLAKALACQGKNAAAMQRLEDLMVKRPKFCLGYLTLAELASAEKIAEVTIRACGDFRRECADNEKIGKFVSPEHRCLCYFRAGLAHAQLGDIEGARRSFTSCESDGTYGKECRKSLELLPK